MVNHFMTLGKIREVLRFDSNVERVLTLNERIEIHKSISESVINILNEWVDEDVKIALRFELREKLNDIKNRIKREKINNPIMFYRTIEGILKKVKF